jgi:ubiquinone/menaquinone biosynthesis C-methylase UbiE
MAPTSPAIKIETVSCCLCGSSDSSEVGRGEDFEYASCSNTWTFVQCRNCSHQYLTPRPRFDEANRIYPETYYTGESDDDPTTRGLVQKIRRAQEAGRYRKVLAMLPENPSVLDVGFGDGRILILLRDLLGPNADLTGLDLKVSDSVKNVLGLYRIRIELALLETYDAPAARWNLVIGNQVLEHFWDPQAAVGKMFQMLAPGGFVFLETPNPNCQCRRLQGNRYFGGFHFPRHLNLFSPADLKRLLTENGFEVVDYSAFVSPSFWITGFRNRLGLRFYKSTDRWIESVNMNNLPTLGFFTVLETLALWTGLGAANHRIIARKPQ